MERDRGDTVRITASRILRGPWRHADAAHVACEQGTWGAFVRETAPPKPGFFGRRDHARCVARAEGSLTGPVTITLTIVPIWACSAEDDVGAEWFAMHAVLPQNGALYVREAGPFLGVTDATPRADAVWECTVKRWSAAVVVESRAYAPDVPLELRAGSFGVCAMDVDEVLAVDVRPGAARPRPTREVPLFTTSFEPRVAVEAPLAAAIEALGFGSE